MRLRNDLERLAAESKGSCTRDRLFTTVAIVCRLSDQNVKMSAGRFPGDSPTVIVVYIRTRIYLHYGKVLAMEASLAINCLVERHLRGQDRI